MKITTFQLARYFFMLTVVILVLFGFGSLLRVNTNPGWASIYIFYAIAMLGDAALMFFCAWQQNKRTKFIYYLSVIVLALNIILTIFDQFGWVDFLFLSLNLVTLILLVIARKEFALA